MNTTINKVLLKKKNDKKTKKKYTIFFFNCYKFVLKYFFLIFLILKKNFQFLKKIFNS